MARFGKAQLTAAFLAGSGLLLALIPPAGVSAPEALAGGLSLAVIGLWATGALPEALTALLFFSLCMLLKVAPGKVVFSGFSSGAFWLVFSGIVFGSAIKSTGLGDRVAHAIGRQMGHSFGQALAGVLILGLGLAFLMPSSMGRIVLMVPLLTALAQHMGYENGSRGWTGLVVGGVFATFLPSFSILPANIPNMVLAGSAESLLGTPPAYADYLFTHFPVLGLCKALILYAALWLLYRGEAPKGSGEPPPGPMTGAERRLALVLGSAISLWITDSLHHVSPAWIGLMAACLCLLPPMKILPPKTLSTMSFEPVLYVAGVIGLGAVIDHAGIGQLVGNLIISALPLSAGGGLADFISLAGLATGVGLATTLPGVPAVLTPFAPQLSAATGLPVASVLMTQVVGFSTVILPYQAPPVMMGIQLAHARLWEFSRLCLIMAAITMLVLWPLDYLWLSLIGKF